jgi:serine protease Do
MAIGLVIHISSGEDRHTEILTMEHVLIGSSQSADLRLRASSLPPNTANGILLELVRSNGSYRVTQFDSSLGIVKNGEALTVGAEIEDGDEVRLRESDLALQFFPVRSLPAVVPPSSSKETHVAPFIEVAAIESAATARRDDAKVFLREFTRELVREIKISTKLITLGIAVALVGGILYIGYAMYKELQRSRNLISAQGTQLGQMKDAVKQTNDQLTEIDRRNKEIRDSLSLAVKLRSEYGNGVCLIAGSFFYVEAGTGRPLRNPEAQTDENGNNLQSGDSQSLTPEGRGPIKEFEFAGTGFYVGKGFVITNRHIAQPWIADDQAQSIGNGVRGQPRLKKLTAYFPGYSEAVLLKVRATAQRDDLAICSLDMTEIPDTIPTLPLETDPDAVAVGKSVVMMGYPNGPDRLLAFLDEAESQGIQQRYGSLDAILGHLAETRHIQPLTTQGNITDLDVRRIAYDARTAEGGSGAPLFGPSGRVIGVNFAVFTENQASNFAVPIGYSLPLLQRAGWEAPPLKEGKEADSLGQPTTHPPPSAAK